MGKTPSAVVRGCPKKIILICTALLSLVSFPGFLVLRGRLPPTHSGRSSGRAPQFWPWFRSWFLVLVLVLVPSPGAGPAPGSWSWFLVPVAGAGTGAGAGSGSWFLVLVFLVLFPAPGSLSWLLVLVHCSCFLVLVLVPFAGHGECLWRILRPGDMREHASF